MNDDVIVTTFVVLDELLDHAGHRDHVLAGVSDAEVLTVAVVAAAYFQNHHARALQVMLGMRYLSGRLSASRFNRRLHALADWFGLAAGDPRRPLCHRRGVHPRQPAAAGLPPGARPPLRQGARAGVLRLLRRQAGAVLRLAPAPGRHAAGGAGRLRHPARRPATT